ncbi:MAG: SpoIIE family protein phosphatase [Verrucomicrobiota bacterium]
MADTTTQGEVHYLPARVELVESLRADFALFLQDLMVGKEEIEQWNLILSEAVVNAIVHGCQSDPKLQVEVRWFCQQNQVVLEVQNPGPGPTEAQMTEAELPDDPLQSHGRGRYLIGQFADKVEHWKGSDGYRLRIMRKHAGIEKNRSGETVLESTLEELSISYESLAAFYRLGDGLVRSESVSRFITQALRELKQILRSAELILYISNELDPTLIQELEALPQHRPWVELSGLQGDVVATRVEQVWESASEVTTDADLADFACGISYPVQAAGDVVGVLTVARRELPYFNSAELNNIRTFADLFGIALANANNTVVREHEQRAYKELEIATEIQRTLLPLPVIEEPPDWSVFARRMSAREIGGDYLEIIHTDSGETIFAMVDVMGKGVPAAFLAAMFRTAFNVLVKTTEDTLQLARSLNRVLCEQTGDMTLFATCALAKLSPASDHLEIVNAGHCPVLLLDIDACADGACADGACESMREVDPSGPPFGLFEDAEYALFKTPISPNHRMYMVTDGLFEWEIGSDLWGWEAFLEFVCSHGCSSAEAFWEQLQLKMRTECPDIAHTRDDQTLLVWTRKPPERA